MKTLLKSKTMIALAVAIAASAGCATNAYEQPIPPPAASADSLPSCIAPGSDLAQVFKLVRAGVDLNVINNFIANASGSFNLDADKIIALNDAGVPSSVLDKMLDHDRQLAAAAATPPPPATPPPATVTTVETAAPAQPVTVNYFYETLSPYGSWVEVSGYGRCWRPTTVVYDSGWRPYCDRGHWVYTDCGWYWDSDYAWGATFHYGRWFRDARFGWCWWPETTWGPSWVVWRSGGDACGWAPLPPLCVYHPDRGFLYRGNTVTVGFDFGLNENYYVFVGYNRFFDRDVRRHCEEPRRVTQIFRNTTIINNYTVINNHVSGGSQNNNNIVVNNGIAADRFHGLSHQAVQPVAVNNLSNARRDGWRGGMHADRATGSPINTSANTSVNNGNSRQPGVGGGAEGSRSRGITTKETGAPAQNQNRQFVNDNQHNLNTQGGGAVTTPGQPAHSSRMEQLRSRQPDPSQPVTTTSAPQPTPLKVEQPQIVHPVTPAQTGAVLDNNNNNNNQGTRRNAWAHPQQNNVINTTPPQRSELQVSQPQIQRPVSSGMVLPTASGRMEQRVVQQQTPNRYGEARNQSVQQSAPVQVQERQQQSQPRASQSSSGSSSNQNSDDNRGAPGRHRQ